MLPPCGCGVEFKDKQPDPTITLLSPPIPTLPSDCEPGVIVELDDVIEPAEALPLDGGCCSTMMALAGALVWPE